MACKKKKVTAAKRERIKNAKHNKKIDRILTQHGRSKSKRK